MFQRKSLQMDYLVVEMVSIILRAMENNRRGHFFFPKKTEPKLLRFPGDMLASMILTRSNDKVNLDTLE